VNVTDLAKHVERPTCAVCKQPVEWMHVYEDPMSCRTTIRIECHGQSEQVELDRFELVAANPGSFAFGEAFAKPERRLSP
jgi:hypothetical protein